MVRPLFLWGGSRGDFEPLLALAQSSELESPVVFVQRDYQSLAPHAHLLPFTLDDMVPSFLYALSKATPGEHSFQTMARAVGYSTAKYILPTLDDVLQVAQDSSIDVVVSTPMTVAMAHVVADKIRVPLVFILFQPCLSSEYVPHSCVMPEKAAEALDMLLKGKTPNVDEDTISTYSLPDVAASEFLEPLNEHRIRLGLPTIDSKRFAEIVNGCAEDVPALIACSPQLVPTPPDWNTSNSVVGALAASYKPENYEPEDAHPELCRFLREGPPPVVVSYGSMGRVVDSAKLTSVILTGLKNANAKRVVLIPGHARLDTSHLDTDSELFEWARDTVFTAQKPVQYSYLLPRASALLCHGGAGTLMAALHAGTPLVVTPITADQPFFANLIARLGLGVATPMGFASLEPGIITEATRTALSDAIVKNVREFSDRERRAPSPVSVVARKLAEIVERSKSK